MIMASLLKWTKPVIRRAPSRPVFFSTSGFETISASEVVEGERFEGVKKVGTLLSC
jgi:serine/threonine-protein kinase SRPK3